MCWRATDPMPRKGGNRQRSTKGSDAKQTNGQRLEKQHSRAHTQKEKKSNIPLQSVHVQGGALVVAEALEVAVGATVDQTPVVASCAICGTAENGCGGNA